MEWIIAALIVLSGIAALISPHLKD